VPAMLPASGRNRAPMGSGGVRPPGAGRDRQAEWIGGLLGREVAHLAEHVVQLVDRSRPPAALPVLRRRGRRLDERRAFRELVGEPGEVGIVRPPVELRLPEVEIAQCAAGCDVGQRVTLAITPRLVAELLREFATVDWSRLLVLFGDERCVPPDHPASNYRMARETLLDRLPIPRGNVLRLRGEDPDPARAAADYAGALQARFPAGPPALDLVLVGMGADGHVASLFPGSPALEERTALVAAPWVERLGAHRLTLTFPVFQAAQAVLLLAVGRDKAARVAEVLGSPGSLPAQRLRDVAADLTVVLDAAAAAGFRRGGCVQTGPRGGIVV